MNLKDFLLQFVTLPWTPRGRRMRIRHLMKRGVERDAAAAIVYARDVGRKIKLDESEIEDAIRIRKLLEEATMATSL